MALIRTPTRFDFAESTSPSDRGRLGFVLAMAKTAFTFTFTDPPSAADVASLEVGDAPLIEITFESEDLTPAAIAAVMDAVDSWLAAGRRVRLIEAPQMLAHTLYKVGRLKNSAMLTIEVRRTEPYAG